MPPRDPIQRVADRSRDLYDVATWEPRGSLDALSVAVYRGLIASARAVVVVLAMLVAASQLALVWVAASEEAVVGAYILLSVVPALALAVYIWAIDVTIREPLDTLVVTFVLSFLFAGFAAVLNTVFSGVVGGAGAALGLGPAILLPVYFFLVVGPVEETVKWAAVRLHAYRTEEFNAVVDGAVYGAVAGLGFATIENSIYISREVVNTAQVSGPVLAETFQTATFRSLAGPGHVIYSAFAGYYLGLAKFNRENRGPIVVKGLLIAALIHATYNTAVTFLPALPELFPALSVLGTGGLFLAFVIVYDGVLGYALYRKLARYRRVYRDTGADTVSAAGAGGDTGPPAGVERDEFE